MSIGTIFGIKRFEIHDGPGTRTTLFLKGCPLRCKWCHNPESLDFCTELGYTDTKCVSCGECVRVCPMHAHSFSEGRHLIDRKKCVGCGLCEAFCLSLKLYGKKVTAEEILPALIEDRPFFGPKGGVTLSGGEPLMQAEFVIELLTLLKNEGVHTAVDTCGYVPEAVFDRVIPYTDLFLFDVKAFKKETHMEATGVSNELILNNLRQLSENGAQIEIRIPLVPGVNADEIGLIAEYLSSLKEIRSVKLLPYHSFASGKYDMMGKTFTTFRQPTVEETAAARKALKKCGLTVVE